MNIRVPRPTGVPAILDRAAAANVSLRQMRAFVAIGRLGSFTRAASMLHTTQPALSARIRELEAALSIRLFDRNTRSVALTQAGADLLPVVEQLLSDVGSVFERARDVTTRSTGRVAVAALPSVASGALPRALASYRKRYPRITLALRDGLADRVIELVRTREVDFGVTSVAGGDDELEFTPVASDRIVALLSRKHPLAGTRRLSLEALVGHPLVLMDRDSSVRHIVDATYAALGRMPAPMFEATFMSTALALVRAGLGMTLLPSSAHEVATASDLVRRTIDHPGLVRTLGIVRMRGRSLSPAAADLAGIVARELARTSSASPSTRSAGTR